MVYKTKKGVDHIFPRSFKWSIKHGVVLITYSYSFKWSIKHSMVLTMYSQCQMIYKTWFYWANRPNSFKAWKGFFIFCCYKLHKIKIALICIYMIVTAYKLAYKLQTLPNSCSLKCVYCIKL